MSLFVFVLRTAVKLGLILSLTTYLITIQSVQIFAQNPEEVVIEDLEYFLKILGQDSCPTIAMAENFCHQSCAEEDGLIIDHYHYTLGKMTDKEGWALGSYFTSIYSDEYCAISPSFYLHWLRKKLPISPKLTIIKIEDDYDNSPWASQTVSVQLDQMSVVFDRNKYEMGRNVFYRITPVIINGQSVHEQLIEDVNNGIMDPVLAEFWGSRETGYEFCGRKMPYRVIDGIPTIIEENKKNEEDKAE